MKRGERERERERERDRQTDRQTDRQKNLPEHVTKHCSVNSPKRKTKSHGFCAILSTIFKLRNLLYHVHRSYEINRTIEVDFSVKEIYIYYISLL